MPYFLIFIGAGFGGVMRYLVSTNAQAMTDGWSFPIGTLAVNVIGCLLIGFLGEMAQMRAAFPPEARLFIFVGVLGGFTTFSSFGYETMQLLRDSQLMLAAANVVAQMVAGLFSVWLGLMVARLIFG